MKKVSKENNKKTPKVRFPGFNDDWEEKKCKDIAPLQRGFDLPVSNMIEGKYPVVMSNGIGGYHNEYKVKGPGARVLLANCNTLIQIIGHIIPLYGLPILRVIILNLYSIFIKN